MGHCGPSFDSNLRICGIRERIHFHVPWHAWQHRRVSIFRPLKWFAKCVHPTVLIDPQFQHKNHLRPAILRYSSFDKPCQVIPFRQSPRKEDPRVRHGDTIRPSRSKRSDCVPAATAYVTHLDTKATTGPAFTHLLQHQWRTVRKVKRPQTQTPASPSQRLKTQWHGMHRLPKQTKRLRRNAPASAIPSRAAAQFLSCQAVAVRRGVASGRMSGACGAINGTGCAGRLGVGGCLVS